MLVCACVFLYTRFVLWCWQWQRVCLAGGVRRRVLACAVLRGSEFMSSCAALTAAARLQLHPPCLTCPLRRPLHMQTATSRAAEVHQLSRTVTSGGSMLPLSEDMLHCLLKSALALEIDATGEPGGCDRLCFTSCCCWPRA